MFAVGADDETSVVLRILVVNGQAYQRRLIGETLRAHARVDVAYAETADQCEMALSYVQPDLLIIDWQLEGRNGLDLIKRIRAGEVDETYRRVPVILIADQARLSDINRARNCGIDEFILRPFSTAALLDRVDLIRSNRREFIESPRYVGPCRRRGRRVEAYDGPRRRMFDRGDKNADAPEVQIRKGLARMYVERMTGLLSPAAGGDRESMRDLCLAAGQLSALASDMRDRLFMSATSSLFNYLKGVSYESAMNVDVVRAHLDATVQLAELPDYQVDLRQTVTQQLGIMVTKKLRQAGQAA